MVAADLDAQPPVLRTHGVHPLVERDPRVGLVERPGVRHVVHPADLDAQHPLGCDDLEAGAGPGDHLRRRHCRVGAVVVEEQDLTGGRDVAADHVPARHHPLGALVDVRELRQAARRHDHDVGIEGGDVVPLGNDVVAHVDTEAGELAHPPLDDAQQVLAPGVAGGQPDLTAGPRHRLEQHDVVAALAGDPGRLEPGRAGADDDHAPSRRRLRDLVRHRLLAARRRVVDAQRLAELVDPVEAVRRPDARPDLGLAAGDDLAHDVRVGEVGPGHADEVDLALPDGVACRRHVVDLRRVQDGERRRRPHVAGEVEVRRRRHAVDRDHVDQARVGRDVAADDVDEVDQPVGLQAGEDLQPGSGVDATGARSRRPPSGCRR